HVAAPVAAASPRDCRSEPFGETAAKGIAKRGTPNGSQSQDSGTLERFVGPITICCDQILTHLVAEIGGIQPQQYSEPALACVRSGDFLMAAPFLEAARYRACASRRVCVRSGDFLMAAPCRACVRSAHLSPFVSKPPSRAAWVKASSRRASALAT